MNKNKLVNAEDHNEKVDVDMRFLLANERTLLSWIRTALAVIAGGLALSQLGEATNLTLVVAIFSTIFGASMALVGYLRFMKAGVAIRNGTLPDLDNAPLIQVVAIICFALLVVAIQIIKLS